MASPAYRRALNRRLWSAVRSLPGGEETMRDMVGRVHKEDGTGADLFGTAHYTSTRKLTSDQLKRLVGYVEERSNPPRRRRSKEGNATFLVTQGERAYVEYMARALGWGDAALARFIAKQTKGKGMRTHKSATAVIEPLERIMTKAGFALHEEDGRKFWDRPTEAQPCA